MRKYFILAISISVIFTGMTFLPRSFGKIEAKIFQVEKGQSIKQISVNLEKNGLIWWSPLFRVYSFLRGRAGNLQAGCYSLSQSMGIPKITEILSSGTIAKEKITIPEGFTSEQISQKLQNVTRTLLVTLDEHEGHLFPDTYEIPYCMETNKIVEMMTENFERKTAGLKIIPGMIIMASLLEKELKTNEDKEIASGILWKRIKSGIPLQVDAEMWTYENYGLPQKPISNPGLDSILAALNPKESQFWYYLSTPEGKTIFSRTLEEHNIAKVRYLK